MPSDDPQRILVAFAEQQFLEDELYPGWSAMPCADVLWLFNGSDAIH